MDIVSLVGFRFGLNTDLKIASTMGYLVLSMTQLFHSINCCSLRESCFKKDFLSNHYLIFTFAFGVLIQVATAQLPFFQKILSTIALNRMQWLIVFLSSMSIIIMNEIGKIILTKRSD